MAIQIRRGTDAEWESNKSNIVAGEPAIAMDTERVFVGTGTGTYVELANIDFVEKAMKEVEYSNFELQSVKGDIVSFSNGAGGIPVKDLQVGIEAVQSGSGDPSPENIRPISGWDEVNVNVAHNQMWQGLIDGYQNPNGSISAPGSVTQEKTSDFVEMEDASSDENYITVQIKYATANIAWACVCFFDANKVALSRPSFSSSSGGTDFTWQVPKSSVPSNAKYMRFSARTYGDADIWISYADDTRNTTTVDISQTVYGGTLDVTTGVLTVDRVMVGGSSWVQYNASNGYKAYRISDCPAGKYNLDTQNNPISNAISEFGSFTSSAMNKNIIQTPHPNSNIAYMALLESVDPSTVFLTYLIATPQVVQLTPTQVTTLLGQNNVWCDTGAIEELTYRISNVQ